MKLEMEVVQARAIEVFGSELRADEWLQKPNFTLGGRTPASELETDAGVERVQRILNSIAYGGVVQVNVCGSVR